jgi:hypothetical protein
MDHQVANVDAEGRRALLIGAGLAVLVLAFPFLRFVFSYMTILVHELGHALFAWLFGYPAIPSFDLYYGGGFTCFENRKTLLMLIVYGGWAGALYAYRRHRPGMVAVAILAGLYTLLAFTPLHRHLISFMGHGTELLFAGIFLYRALSGYGIKVAAERPLYAFLAFFIVATDLRFAVGLVRSPVERQLYAEAKGGGDWMDFSLLARGFGVELTSVAGIFAVCALLTLPATMMIYRHRAVWIRAIHAVLLEPWFSSDGFARATPSVRAAR